MKWNISDRRRRRRKRVKLLREEKYRNTAKNNRQSCATHVVTSMTSFIFLQFLAQADRN